MMLTRSKPLFALLLLLVGLSFTLPQTGILDRLQSAFDRYQQRGPEKLYLHTDKPFYSSGEVIWFKVYQVDAVDHRPGGPSGLARIDLVDPQGALAFSRFIKLEEGVGAGDIRLPQDLATGTYRLQAYTNYMKAFGEDWIFHKDLPIWNRQVMLTDTAAVPGQAIEREALPADTTIVRFFPEGGDLVVGLESNVAVRVENGRGQGLPAQGRIVDGEGATVAAFTTSPLGLATFPLTPRAGVHYQALVEGLEQGPVALPEPLPEGYVMSVRPEGAAAYRIHVQASAGRTLSGMHLVGQSRGKLLFVTPLSSDEDSSRKLRLGLDSLPEGVLHLTVMDAEGRPFAERLAFVQHADRPRVRMQSTRQAYATRSPVTVQLDLLNEADRPVSGELSVTVTSRELVPRNPWNGDIRSWLLLNSDLRGDIPHPGYFLEPGQEEELDLLMLTQGWRRFTWQDMLAGDWPSRTQARQGFTVAGEITRLGTDEGENAYIWLNTLGFGEILEARTVSQPDGRFAVHDLPIQDTTVVVVQARRPRNGQATLTNMPENPRGNRNLDIRFIEPDIPELDPERLPGPVAQPAEDVKEEYLAESRRIQTIERAFGGISVLLDEVVVTAERMPRETFDRPGMLYREPSNRIVADSMMQFFQPNSAFDFLRTTAGVQVVGGFPNERAIIRGGGRVLYLLDGMPVDAQVIQSLNPNDVAFVDVLKGPAAGIYGGRGANGVIAYYTRRGEESIAVPERGPGIDHFTHPGFYQARRFYQPVYEEEQPEHERPDYRTTLFWRPDIRMAEDGKALITIWTSDQTGTYEVWVEGITDAGQAVTGTYSFTVGSE